MRLPTRLRRLFDKLLLVGVRTEGIVGLAAARSTLASLLIVLPVST